MSMEHSMLKHKFLRFVGNLINLHRLKFMDFFLGHDDDLCGRSEQAKEDAAEQWVRGCVWGRGRRKSRRQCSCV